jgi:hypothetical protein
MSSRLKRFERSLSHKLTGGPGHRKVTLPLLGETKVKWVDLAGVVVTLIIVGAIVAMVVLFAGPTDTHPPDDEQENKNKENLNAPPGSVRNAGDALGDRLLSSIQANLEPVQRECYPAETKCRIPDGNKPSRCVGADGRPVDSKVTTNDGRHYCCAFGCESQIPTYRTTCKSDQYLCNTNVRNQRVCVMDDDKVVVPQNMLYNGNGCCEFTCFDPASLPQRACFPDEVVCPGRSYCYNFGQEIVVPRAVNNNGNVCCPQTGRKVCVALDSSKDLA